MCFSKKICFAGLLVFFITGGFGQTYNFRNYNTEQGLPQSQVLCIYQDQKGYVWFGTNSGGAGKFDGNKFSVLNTNQGLINNVVFSITGTDKGELVFGTGKGLSVYNHFTFKNFDEKNGLKSTTVYEVTNFKEKIWIGTDKGVYIYDGNKVIPFTPDTVLNSSSVYSIFIDKDQHLWFATLQNGVIYYDPSTGSFKHFTVNEGLMNNFIFSVSQMKDGTILVGTQTGLNKITPAFEVKRADEIKANQNISFSSIIAGEDNTFFFGTYSEGLLHFNFTQLNGINYHANNGLCNNAILSLLKDREGNVWIGTDGAGAYKFHGNKFTYYTKTNGLPEKYVSAVAEDSRGNLWLAMPGNGVVKKSGRETEHFKADYKNKNSLPDNTTNAILATGEGKVFFGTQDGLGVYENGKFTISEEEAVRHKYILCFYQDVKKNIWIGTTEGAFVYAAGKVSPCVPVNALKNEGMEFMVLSITEDRYGKIWFGTENGALVLQNNKVASLNSDKDFVNGRVGSCITDKKGNIWLGTEKGLYFYNNNTFTKIEKEYGLTPSFINLLLIDKLNHLYVGTNNGIDIIDLNAFYQNKKEVRHMGKDDGLLSLESNSNAGAIDKNGNVLIGTVSGLEIYNPTLDKLNTLEAATSITNIKLFFGTEDISRYAGGTDSVTQLPRDLVLPYSKNNLTFAYTGISLVAPEKVLYQYQLAGVDKDWTPPVSKTEVTYPSLPPGTYTFYVKSMNNDGLWNKTPATFSFTILAPWYKTWWFYTLCAAFLAIGIASYNYLKTKKLVADKQKLERIVDERTRELRIEKEKVTEQKMEIEHKNVEITDSIKYAKNIQEALLPSLGEIEKAFSDCFVLYMPKDIVSGDFFWYYKNGETQYIAAADCTGHGVPGAFMSIVGNTLLNEIVEQKNISAPGDILLELHKGVKFALHQSEQESQRRDGMDIALCALNKPGGTIEYSGANRPLWIYRKNKAYGLEVIKPTKFAIGGIELEGERKYVNHSIPVSSGDMIYIFSDGFADQFGGPRGKKLMVSNMQKLLFENIQFPASEQKQKIKDAFENWKSNREQIDDVCVIGIRV